MALEYHSGIWTVSFFSHFQKQRLLVSLLLWFPQPYIAALLRSLVQKKAIFIFYSPGQRGAAKRTLKSNLGLLASHHCHETSYTSSTCNFFLMPWYDVCFTVSRAAVATKNRHASRPGTHRIHVCDTWIQTGAMQSLQIITSRWQ